MPDRQPPLPDAAKAALREVLEVDHPPDRDLLALLDEVDTLTEQRDFWQRQCAADHASAQGTLSQLRHDVARDLAAVEDCLAILIARAGGTVEIPLAELRALERGHLVRGATPDAITLTWRWPRS